MSYVNPEHVFEASAIPDMCARVHCSRHRDDPCHTPPAPSPELLAVLDFEGVTLGTAIGVLKDNARIHGEHAIVTGVLELRAPLKEGEG